MGVEYLKQKNLNETFVVATKEKKFEILGGGISGLLTALINLLRFLDLLPCCSLMKRAIERIVFDGAVKAAMQYKERFWEHLEHPIVGGCGRVDIYGIGQLCYPSYKINSTGLKHIAYIQCAMVELHGLIADEMWTGNYTRHCWDQDERHADSWTVPIVPQQQLCLPAF
ncbi:hypothetical protein BU25DRAFT_465593 [Macroventuria anomochaeta]|uniref:Uncharacterized protein n=1 Tax=Macroventuria anomochaeta TaxID=301207 RepID=A0ACB6S5D1_9PLEO|nr:uncharacterized protein BU25DRAFT_465593 [Macroventuria anomochaeta]KAF2629386.1 hypothetical protein BU25DRAFT_465593 [Macroventuria anomochaeta]